MKLQKFRWSKVYESSEEELSDFLRARQLASERWAAEAFDKISKEALDHAMTLWCAEGSLVIEIDGSTASLQPGDALRLPVNFAYSLDVGMTGCVCYETN